MIQSYKLMFKNYKRSSKSLCLHEYISNFVFTTEKICFIATAIRLSVTRKRVNRILIAKHTETGESTGIEHFLSSNKPCFDFTIFVKYSSQFAYWLKIAAKIDGWMSLSKNYSANHVNEREN